MLDGERVRLRAVEPSDVPLLARWHGDADYVGEHFNVWPQSEDRWARETGRDPGPNAGMYVVVEKEEDTAAGTIGYWVPFSRPDLFGGLEVWYRVHPVHRGRGVATAALCLLVNHLFDATPVPRVQATVVVGNHASCRVALNAGMQQDGVYRRVYFLHGRWVDCDLYSIVREDWRDESTYRRGRPPF